MGLCFKIIEIWNLFDIWDFVYWNFWFIQVRGMEFCVNVANYFGIIKHS